MTFSTYIIDNFCKKNYFPQKKWNLVLLLGNDKKNEFEKDLQIHKFIKSFEILPFTSNPLQIKLINIVVSLKGYISKALFGTKLAKSLEVNLPENISKICQNAKTDKPFIMVNINKNNPKNSHNEEYGNKVVMNLFPIVGSRIFTAGNPDSEHWDKIALVRYRDK